MRTREKDQHRFDKPGIGGRHKHWHSVAAVFAGSCALVSGAAAQTTQDLPPNLVPLPAFNVTLVPGISGTSTLRFSTTTWNNGTGPLRLIAGAVDTGSGKQQVYQEIALSDGSSFLHFAGAFQYHDEHSHIHFDDFAEYSLQPLAAPGGSLLTGSKVTFCVMDTTKIDTRLPGAPKSAVYTTCGSQIQGMSVGWGDTYGSHLPGQEFDFTGNPDGIYQLKVVADPKGLLVETSESDNVACTLLDIRQPSTVIVLDTSASCSSVLSITPNQGAAGTSFQVQISGYGLTAGMGVSFERGNGPRPVASNVQLVSDTDTLDWLSAVVTIPSPKRNPGRDPVWDVRVGDSVLEGSFTVLTQ
jgi:hypothetical protein